MSFLHRLSAHTYLLFRLHLLTSMCRLVFGDTTLRGASKGKLKVYTAGAHSIQITVYAWRSSVHAPLDIGPIQLLLSVENVCTPWFLSCCFCVAQFCCASPYWDTFNSIKINVRHHRYCLSTFDAWVWWACVVLIFVEI